MSYTHLSPRDRYVIAHLVHNGKSYRDIGRKLGRHHTTISREVQRNSPTYDKPVYWYTSAQQYADRRKHIARGHRRRSNYRLVRYVIQKLQQEWSPEQISGAIRLQYSEDETMRISHETIYQWSFIDAANGGNLFEHMRRRHKKRRRQKRYGLGRRFFQDRVSIHDRPGIVETRFRLGDWEGDTLEGAKGSGAIATHVDRKSRYLIAAKLPDKKAKTMSMMSSKAFYRIQRRLRKTLTVDNGKEFAEFKLLERQTGLTVYFADPYSSWQRGTNENTNGLIRQYIPKGTNLRKISPAILDEIVRRLNHRPRKILNFRTPHEVF